MGKKKKISNHDGSDRKFCAMLYEDSTTYSIDEVLTKIAEYAQEYSYCRHDRDIDDEGELKKPHYHVCMKFPTPRIRATIANQLGIEKNYIERAETWKGANRYLMHLDDDDKFPYAYYDVTSNFDFVNLVDYKVSETVKVKEIMCFIWTDECKTLIDVAEFASQHNLWSEYRRSYPILKDYFREVQIIKNKETQT